MNTKQTEALKLALEALTHLQPTALTSFYTIGDRDKAITAIREALAEQPAQQQEPVAWINWSALTGERRLGWQCESELASEPLYAKPPTKYQEPLCTAAMFDDAFLAKSGLDPNTKLYTSPPASKPWVGLTDVQIGQVLDDPNIAKPHQGYWRVLPFAFARAIEAKLREKNA